METISYTVRKALGHMVRCDFCQRATRTPVTVRVDDPNKGPLNLVFCGSAHARAGLANYQTKIKEGVLPPTLPDEDVTVEAGDGE